MSSASPLFSIKPSPRPIRTSAGFAASEVITGQMSVRPSGRPELHDLSVPHPSWRQVMHTLKTDSLATVRTEIRRPEHRPLKLTQTAESLSSARPPRPGWIEIDSRQLKRNFQ